MQKREAEVSISPDQMEARVIFPLEKGIEKEEVQDLLKREGIEYGILDDRLFEIAENGGEGISEMVIAVGSPAEDGKDGVVRFDQPLRVEVDIEKKRDFRDIIRIPCVSEGERIAVIEPPTKGKTGVNVFGEPVEPEPGKPPRLRAGKHTTFKRSGLAYYADIDGQLSYDERSVQVHPLYEVQGDLDLHTGDLDFIGSILIKGNVPAGFTIKAGGDITVYGMVEAADLEAGGSVHISEGLAGTGKALIKAGQDVRVGAVNQAFIEAGQDLIVENSILHSDCVVQGNLFCQKGSIIGGTTSVGRSVNVQSLGNRMHTPTRIYIGVNKKVEEKQKKLNDLLKAKMEEEQKLLNIRAALENKSKEEGRLASKDRITSLRLRNSLQKVNEEIQDMARLLQSLNSSIGDWKQAYIKVTQHLYAFTEIVFGKYHLRIPKDVRDVYAVFDEGEIMVRDNEVLNRK